jgi:hypothetical protein
MDGCGWGDCLDCHFEASASGSGSGRGSMRSSVRRRGRRQQEQVNRWSELLLNGGG